MKNNIFLKQCVFAGLMSLLLMQTACDDTKIPSDFYPEQYFEIESSREINIGSQSSFTIDVNASSSWEASSKASWCHFDRPIYAGKDSAIVNVDANYGDEERSCYIIIKTFTKDNPQIDSVFVIQPVNSLPALEVTPVGEKNVFYKGGKFVIDVLYNYSVNFELNNLSDQQAWISTDISSFEESETMTTKSMEVIVEPNMGTENREAELIFTSTRDPEKTYIVRVKQSHYAEPVTSFADSFTFDVSMGSNKPYPGEGWTFQSNLSGRTVFKTWAYASNPAMLVYHGSESPRVTGYGILPVFNIKNMKNKKLSYKWGSGNSNPAIKENGDAFELVASVDYEGDAFAATWIVVQDLIDWEKKPSTGLPNKEVKVDFESTPFAEAEAVYVAFRYAGGKHAYRVDNLKVGDVAE